MDFYHSWIYVYIFNATWFLWMMVVIVLGGNILAPVIIWFLMSGRGMPFTRNKKNKAKQG